MFIEYEIADKTTLWDGSFANLLERAESKNIPVRSSCGTGSCLNLRKRLNKGAVDYYIKALMEVQNHHFLLCCTTPSIDLILEL